MTYKKPIIYQEVYALMTYKKPITYQEVYAAEVKELYPGFCSTYGERDWASQKPTYQNSMGAFTRMQKRQ